ncbi:putative serine/threonine-protein kinase [Heracleum sosnowskyi]|uniref:non-specific serine/threonine protein kinase n=1 Tax=Heracleum sosnowskyi TaxID=360622 RepID=A0AAD8H9H4_9APIA|nr:putative serine/threonine-protein kinase [Heracleum sosnowskyi]
MSATSLSHFPMHLPFFLLLLISAATPSFTTNDPTSYPNCTNTFSCGPIQNITYPFTGGDRPIYCGPPQFHLTCPNNNTYPELTFNSLGYRLLHINQTHQTLTLARSDLFNTTCPQKFINATFNSSVFTVGEDNVMLNLIYGCFSTSLNPPLLNVFSCNVNGVEYSDAYYFVGLVPVINFIRCAVSVVVPILGIAGERLRSNLATLDDVLASGFRVNYSDPYSDECLDCSLSGGQCGFLANPIRPVCICQNKLCVDAGKHKSSSKTLSTVLYVVGATIAGIAIGWLIISCRQRRKQRIAQSATHTESKDLPATPSANALTTATSTPFTKSIPSYSSSGFESGKGSTYFGVQVFNYTELEEATDNFNPSRELGDGGFSTVYYGTLQDGRIVAVKRLYENNFKRVEQFMNEVEILTKLNHKNLVKLYGCTSKRSRDLLLVYEYIPNGTVADHLHALDTNRDRFDINLASMAISKIQNQTINELIDQRLGFESNASVKKMTTLVAELAFRCLQEEKDLRPTMQEVVETLKEIQHEDSDVQKSSVLEIVVEEDAPLKGKEGSYSPDSVADKWISNSTSLQSE